jgi:hypothetical protein
MKFVNRSLQRVRAGLGCECDAAAAGLSELGLEAVGLDRELGDRLERWCEERGLGRVGVSIRIDRNTVEGGAERTALTAAEGRLAGASRLRNRGDESNGLRIAPPTTSGSSSINWLDTFVETFAFSVSIAVLSATTFTDSAIEPSSMPTSTRAVPPAVTLTSSTLADLNP